MKFCPWDQRNVDTEHSWDLTVLILLLVFLTLIGLIYMAVKWKERCPSCKAPEEYLLPVMVYQPPLGPPGYVAYPQPVYQAPPSYPCSKCGATLTWYAQYSRWYCAHESRWV